VLGTFAELEQVIEEQDIDELIFTHHYSDELRASILALQPKYSLLIRDFVFVLRDLDHQGTCRGVVKPYSVTDIDCRNLCIHQDQPGINRKTTFSDEGQTATAPD